MKKLLLFCFLVLSLVVRLYSQIEVKTNPFLLISPLPQFNINIESSLNRISNRLSGELGYAFIYLREREDRIISAIHSAHSIDVALKYYFKKEKKLSGFYLGSYIWNISIFSTDHTNSKYDVKQSELFSLGIRPGFKWVLIEGRLPIEISLNLGKRFTNGDLSYDLDRSPTAKFFLNYDVYFNTIMGYRF